MQNDPRLLSADSFDYALSEEQIALFPLEKRDQSKLLVYEKGLINDATYQELPAWLPENCQLVFNHTKVIPARILFEKPSGGIIEIFCLAPDPTLGDMNAALTVKESLRMQCLVGGASKWQAGSILTLQKEGQSLQARIISKEAEYFLIEFTWLPAQLPFAAMLTLFGEMPLPPYLKRKAIAQDQERYQTVYAKKEGSVAAPTAGLHFTPELIHSLQKKSIRIDQVTLHVGAGTFKPVKASRMEGHIMHAEWIEMDLDFLKRWLHHCNNPLIAVGTTSLRSLESAYWIGVKLIGEKRDTIPSLNQWECYQLATLHVPLEKSLQAIIDWLEKNNLQKLATHTSLMIGPGYRFKTAVGLLTNFHQPRSTLLLLVAAFVGEDWRKIYDHALQHQYRMLSYGDGSLLWRNQELGNGSGKG